jgi:hypothetical protein
MKKQLIVVGIFAILISTGLSGCGGQNGAGPTTEKEKFVGTWKNTSEYVTMELSSDGTCTSWGYTGTWGLRDGKLVLNVTSVGVPFTYTYVYVFFNNNTTVKLIPTKTTTGKGYVLTKQ